MLLFWISRHWYGCSIAGTARIGGGLILPHPQNIVIGGQARIGDRAWIFHNVTIGGAPAKDGMATIGNDARLFAGAVIVGPVTIGDDVWVGANSVISKDIPSKMIARSDRPSVVPRSDVYIMASGENSSSE